MSNSYMLACKKCSDAQNILYETDQYDVADSIEATINFVNAETVEVNNLVSWLVKHKEHSEIVFRIEC